MNEQTNLPLATAKASIKDDGDLWRRQYRTCAARFLAQLRPGEQFTGEDMRRYIAIRIGNPQHHNAWGGMASHLFTQWQTTGVIEPAGWRRLSGRKSGKRLSITYRRVEKRETGLRGVIRWIFGG